MQRILKAFVIGIVFLFVQNSAIADSSNDALNQLLKGTHSMRADFTQRIINNKGKMIQVSQGKMALQRPGQFRWQTLTPNQQLVVASGTRLYIYDPDLEQVIVRSIAKQAGETPALLLSNENTILEADFKVQITKNDSKLRWFVLLPKDKGSMFASIRMGFIGEQLQEMQLRDHLDNTTIVEFKNIHFNVKLPSALFNFAPPKSVDVIDETKR